MTLYAKLGITTANDHGKVKHVTKYFEFASEEHLEDVEDNYLFDMVIEEINDSLQQDNDTKGYFVDDCIELVDKPLHTKPSTNYPIWIIKHNREQFIQKD